jgi:hypothetical protein
MRLLGNAAWPTAAHHQPAKSGKLLSKTNAGWASLADAQVALRFRTVASRRIALLMALTRIIHIWEDAVVVCSSAKKLARLTMVSIAQYMILDMALPVRQ